MAVWRIQFNVRRISAKSTNFMSKPAHMGRREQEIRANAYKQSLTANTAQRLVKRSVTFTGIIQIHGATQIEITIRIKALYQRLTLMIKIAFNIKTATQIRIMCGRRNISTQSRLACKAQFHGLLALIG